MKLQTALQYFIDILEFNYTKVHFGSDPPTLLDNWKINEKHYQFTKYLKRSLFTEPS